MYFGDDLLDEDICENVIRINYDLSYSAWIGQGVDAQVESKRPALGSLGSYELGLNARHRPEALRWRRLVGRKLDRSGNGDFELVQFKGEHTF